MTARKLIIGQKRVPTPGDVATLLTALALLTVSLLASPAWAQSKGIFESGTTHGNLIIGSGQFNGDNNVIVGASVGYYVLDGLRLGLEGDIWLGGDTTVGRLSPSLNYTLWSLPTLKPYAGVFYRRWFVESFFDDLNTLGVRGGVYFTASKNAYIGLGVAYESQVAPECRQGEDCDYFYPEFTAAFSF